MPRVLAPMRSCSQWGQKGPWLGQWTAPWLGLQVDLLVGPRRVPPLAHIRQPKRFPPLHGDGLDLLVDVQARALVPDRLPGTSCNAWVANHAHGYGRSGT